MSESQIELLGPNDNIVKATLLDGLQVLDLSVIGQQWGPAKATIMASLMASGVDRSEWPQSLHWDWSRKAGELAYLEVDGFGIISEGKWQGAMLTKSATEFCRLESQLAKPLVYVDFLEAAPWNWEIPGIDQSRQLRAIGSVLLRVAVEHSRVKGFKGRVGLHSLRQAEGFYREACGMSATERDPHKQDLLYLEFTKEQADLFLPPSLDEANEN